jgi:hypothetical protein
MKRQDQRSRRKQRRAGKRRQSRRPANNKHTAPRTAKEYFAKPERSQDVWNRVVHVISKMRADNLSLSQSSREFGIAPRTVIRLGGSALRKRKNGRYAVKPSDRLLRILVVPTPEGVREIAVRDSRQASRLGEYWAAVQKYLATGDTSAIDKFHRKRVIDASRKRIPLLTNLEELDRLASAGVLSFESLYASVV